MITMLGGRMTALFCYKGGFSLKRLFCLFLLVAVMLSFSGCQMFAEVIGTVLDANPILPERLASYEEDVPAQMIRAGEYWITLVSAYGSANYAISVSTDPEELRVVYAAEGAGVWFFEATEEYVAWCEWDGDNREYKVYSIADGRVETIFSADVSEHYQPSNVGILGDGIYYGYIDYPGEKAGIFRYDMNSRSTELVCETKYAEAYSIMCLSVEGQYLSYASMDGIRAVDLQSGDTVFAYQCPENVAYIYAVSYDASQDVMGIYYADNDSEDVGVVREADGEPLSLFTFNAHHYAYQDQIRCADGHIYWINQANVSGQIADHYNFVDYNYMNHTYSEVTKAFHFSLYGDTVYLLRFGNTEGVKDVDLYEMS